MDRDVVLVAFARTVDGDTVFGKRGVRSHAEPQYENDLGADSCGSGEADLS
jgi:hypothetical protein